MINTRGYNGTTDNIDALCRYFGCKVEDVMIYVPDVSETAQAEG
jgi:putative transcriptional regulator